MRDEKELKAELHRLERLFHHLDRNKDGVVGIEDLIEGLHQMGYYHISRQQIDDFLKLSDANKSGNLILSEFVNYLREHEKQLHFVFHSLDENKDGKLCVDEIIGAFKKMGISITPTEAEGLLKRINFDDNSLDISYEEWRDYLLFHPSSELRDIIHSWRHNYLDLGEDLGVPDDFTPEEYLSGMWWRHLVAGGCAGAVSRTCTAPLDRLKIILQVHGGRKSYTMKEAFVYMFKEGGVRGLWRGNGVNVIKIAPESALKFGAYDWIKNRIKGPDEERDFATHERLIAGSAAGGISQSAIYPLEVLKTRFALRKTNEYKGIFCCVRKLLHTDGIRGFYRGYVPNLLGILPYAGIDLTIYETLKIHYLNKYSSTEDSSPPAFILLSCGTFSSCCGQLAAYPLALVRTKLQSQAGLNLNLPKEQTRMIGLFKYTIRNEGVKGLYRGIIANFCKVAPAVSISYYVYERTIGYLGAQMT
ncbi:calcium-binding mitochondrial carrier protein SCaMC-2 [Lepeophtheirus salmonis]|nr:calcium-binding mitochondrial carrier protein SCaMC-2-like [Lepeophtheirus salmonis]XP_040577783.1 calcium-binding mitochondrial carrier protein SCaMC-2-like [Lepeophtheirus salmonis]